jgi:DNA-binding transcriptional ArsR family regulator
LAGSDLIHSEQVKAQITIRRQSEIKIRSTRIKIGSRCVPSASHRGAAVVTYARMVMGHQKFAIIEEAAAANTSPSSLSVLFRALADSSRLLCLLALRERPRTVGQIAAAPGFSQPNVSKHLSRLPSCGLVCAERSGRSMTYGMADPGVKELLGAADALLAAQRSPSKSIPPRKGERGERTASCCR